MAEFVVRLDGVYDYYVNAPELGGTGAYFAGAQDFAGNGTADTIIVTIDQAATPLAFEQLIYADDPTNDTSLRITDGDDDYAGGLLHDNSTTLTDQVELRLPQGWSVTYSNPTVSGNGYTAAGWTSNGTQYVTIRDAGGNPWGGVSNHLWVDTDILTINFVCFARGTLVMMGDGTQRAVEDLRPDDMIMTRDRGPQPLRWIGSKFQCAETLEQFPNYRPIRIKAGTFGNDRDLVVSPQHRILVTGDLAHALSDGKQQEVLVAAKALINDSTVMVDHGLASVEYFHLLFDRHEIIKAEGCWSESFLPGGYSMKSLAPETFAEVVALFPELEDASDGTYPPARPVIKPGQVRRKVVVRNLY